MIPVRILLIFLIDCFCFWFIGIYNWFVACFLDEFFFRLIIAFFQSFKLCCRLFTILSQIRVSLCEVLLICWGSKTEHSLGSGDDGDDDDDNDDDGNNYDGNDRSSSSTCFSDLYHGLAFRKMLAEPSLLTRRAWSYQRWSNFHYLILKQLGGLEQASLQGTV